MYKKSTRLVEVVFLLFVLLTSACGNDTSPSETIDVQATIDASVEATAQAVPTNTPGERIDVQATIDAAVEATAQTALANTPEPTPTNVPSETIDVQATIDASVEATAQAAPTEITSVQVFKTSAVTFIDIHEETTFPELNPSPTLEEIEQQKIEYLLNAKSWQFHPGGEFVFSDAYGNQYTGWWVDQNGEIQFEGRSEILLDGFDGNRLVEGKGDGHEMTVRFESWASSTDEDWPSFSSSKYTAILELK